MARQHGGVYDAAVLSLGAQLHARCACLAVASLASPLPCMPLPCFSGAPQQPGSLPRRWVVKLVALTCLMHLLLPKPAARGGRRDAPSLQGGSTGMCRCCIACIAHAVRCAPVFVASVLPSSPRACKAACGDVPTQPCCAPVSRPCYCDRTALQAAQGDHHEPPLLLLRQLGLVRRLPGPRPVQARPPPARVRTVHMLHVLCVHVQHAGGGRPMVGLLASTRRAAIALFS